MLGTPLGTLQHAGDTLDGDTSGDTPACWGHLWGHPSMLGTPKLGTPQHAGDTQAGDTSGDTPACWGHLGGDTPSEFFLKKNIVCLDCFPVA